MRIEHIPSTCITFPLIPSPCIPSFLIPSTPLSPLPPVIPFPSVLSPCLIELNTLILASLQTSVHKANEMLYGPKDVDNSLKKVEEINYKAWKEVMVGMSVAGRVRDQC